MAYASLVSLGNILDQNLQLNLIPQDDQHIQTLVQEIILFQDFLDKSSNKSSETVKCLESRIRDVTHEAQGIIEFHVAGLLHGSETREKCFMNLLDDLDEVMEEINSIKQAVMQIEEDKDEEDNNDQFDLEPRISQLSISSRTPWDGMTTLVGLDDDFKEIKSRLVSNSLQRETVALVGMGGIGKTTLAQKIYDDKSIVSRFDICRWVTVSQEYSMKHILSKLLGYDKISNEHIEELGLDLYKSLKNRRYLIVLDDIWDSEVWDRLKRVLPNDENGSRILLTTREEQVANHENSIPPHHVRLLNIEESWDLFCKAVGRDGCPPELEKVGKEIVENCRGLPLAVKVIGGHLSKAPRTEHYWKSVANDLSETIASEDDEQCLKVLSLSYEHLPHHLKGCFLYMGIFQEDYEIKVSMLVCLWIGNGLIKKERSKTPEDVYEEYFLDLVKRNLILVSKRKYNGKITFCKIHDLVKDLCIKKAENERVFHRKCRALFYDNFGDLNAGRHPMMPTTLYSDEEFKISMFLPEHMTNIWGIHCNNFIRVFNERLVSSIHKFQHLHTIHVCAYSFTLNIWEMPQLRHVKIVKFYATVPDAPATKIEGGNSCIVLEHLQTLDGVVNLVFSNEVLQRIPNLKKLGIGYFDGRAIDVEVTTDWRKLELNNLEHLHKLESLICGFGGNNTPVVLQRDITFPPSIKKLALRGSRIPWEDMTVVGSLPNLQVLKLKRESFVGKEWIPNEGEFLNLKALHLEELGDLVHWSADVDHFPELQHLIIKSCSNLREIPSSFGAIATLQFIQIYRCTRSVASSAKKIEEDQLDYSNEGFRLEIEKIL